MDFKDHSQLLTIEIKKSLLTKLIENASINVHVEIFSYLCPTVDLNAIFIKQFNRPNYWQISTVSNNFENRGNVSFLNLF